MSLEALYLLLKFFFKVSLTNPVFYIDHIYISQNETNISVRNFWKVIKGISFWKTKRGGETTPDKISFVFFFVSNQGQGFSSDPVTQNFIYLLGNPVIWWGNILWMVVFLMVWIVKETRTQRGIVPSETQLGELLRDTAAGRINGSHLGNFGNDKRVKYLSGGS